MFELFNTSADLKSDPEYRPSLCNESYSELKSYVNGRSDLTLAGIDFGLIHLDLIHLTTVDILFLTDICTLEPRGAK